MRAAAVIVTDTTVVSELMRLIPEPAVMAWFSGQDTPALELAAVSEAPRRGDRRRERRARGAVLPASWRRDRLAGAIDAVSGEDLAGRVLPFDSAAAQAYAALAASRRSLGRRIPEANCQIAAIARARDWAVAARNPGDLAQV